MIKTAKMQGNVMVSAGGRGARGPGKPAVGTGDGGRVPTPGNDREPRAGRGAAAATSHLDTPPPPGLLPPPPPAQRRPPGCGGSGVYSPIATLRLCAPSALGRWLVPWARGRACEVGKGRQTSPRRPPVGPSSQPSPRAVWGDLRRARSPRPGEERWARVPAPASGLRVPEPETCWGPPTWGSLGREPVARLRLLSPRPPAGRGPAPGCDNDGSPERLAVPASVTAAHPPREEDCAPGTPPIGGGAQGCRPGAIFALPTLLTRGPRRPASPPPPARFRGPRHLWRPSGPLRERGRGTAGGQGAGPSWRGRGGCHLGLWKTVCVPERVYLADGLTLSGLVWDAWEEGLCLPPTRPPAGTLS